MAKSKTRTQVTIPFNEELVTTEQIDKIVEIITGFTSLSFDTRVVLVFRVPLVIHNESMLRALGLGWSRIKRFRFRANQGFKTPSMAAFLCGLIERKILARCIVEILEEVPVISHHHILPM